MKRTIITLALAAAAFAAGHLHGSKGLAAYREELDFLNNLSPAQLLAEIDDTGPEDVNAAVLARMDARELLGAALDALAADGADAEDIAEAIADAREGAQK